MQSYGLFSLDFLRIDDISRGLFVATIKAGRSRRTKWDPRLRKINEDGKKGLLNPMNDAFFKFLLGKEESKRLTIDFLNAVLGSELQETIEDITFLPT